MAPRQKKKTDENDDYAMGEGQDERSSLLDQDADPAGNAVADAADDDRQSVPWSTTAALCFCMMIQSYLLISVFPYAGFLAIHLVDNVNEETAGKYAGFIASSFMLGRTFSSYAWGQAADVYGRTFVIRASLLTSAVFSVLFGLAPTFTSALAIRFLLGVCNGLIGPIKTIVSELARNNTTQETKLLALVMGIWGYGFLINPALSGYLSDPLKQYPDLDFGPLFGPLLAEFPYFLPNIFGTIMCLAGYFLVYFGVPETLPEEKRREFRIGEVVYSCYRSCCQSIVEIVQSISSWIHPTTEYQSPLSNNEEEHSLENGSINYQPDVQKHIHDDDKPATIRSLWSRPSTRQHMLIYWLYSFLVISVDEVFPLFCISKESGLGIQEQRIGNLLTATGLCYLVMQYVVLTKLVESYGFYKALRIGALCSIPVVCLIPLSLLTNMGAEIGTLTWSSLSFLGLVYATTRVFSSVVFSTITMTTNRTVPSHHRATMNGLSMLGGSLAKAAGPAFAGVLFSVSVGTIPPPYGSVVVYGIISLMGVGLYMQATRLEEPSLDEIEGK